MPIPFNGDGIAFLIYLLVEAAFNSASGTGAASGAPTDFFDDGTNPP